MSNFLKSIYSFVNYQRAFVFLSTIVNVFFLLYFFGFLKNQNEMVETISFYLKIFIGIFLVVKFNPFYNFATNHKKFTEFDRTVVFSAGSYLLIINGIGIYNSYLKDKEQKLKRMIDPALDPSSAKNNYTRIRSML
jgi:hypothetical protein